jgi:hypothetical protein
MFIEYEILLFEFILKNNTTLKRKTVFVLFEFVNSTYDERGTAESETL